MFANTETVLSDCGFDSVHSCDVTNDRNRLPHADAVVIHPRDIAYPSLPAHVNEQQRFVFKTAEPPHATTYWPGNDVHL